MTKGDLAGEKTVAVFSFRHEAETAAGFLEAEGIPAVVFADDGGGTYPGLPGLGGAWGARVVVRGDQAGEATLALQDAGLLPREGGATQTPGRHPPDQVDSDPSDEAGG